MQKNQLLFDRSNYPDGIDVKMDGCVLKGALSGLRQFSAIESPLKIMKNAFYFTSKALFALKIFKFLS